MFSEIIATQTLILSKGEYEGGYGGALYMYYLANVDMFQVTFRYNYAEFRGGAIYIDYGANLDCDECDFEHNRAKGYGGAVFAQNRQSRNGMFIFMKNREKLCILLNAN